MHPRVASILSVVAIVVVWSAGLGRSPDPVTAQPGEPVTGRVVICPASTPGTAVAAPAPAAIADPSVPTSPAPEARPVGTWPGRWERMADAPIVPRTGAAIDVAIWEDRIYLWGGRGADGQLLSDGASYDVLTGRWGVLPESGLAPRERFGFDADNIGITIWGGLDAQGAPLGDGARLILSGDARRPSWTALPPAPLTPGPASMSGDLNITIVVTPGAAPGDPLRWAVLDPDGTEGAALGWDESSDPDVRVHGQIPAPPVPPGIAYEVASAGEDFLLLSYQPDGTAIGSWFTGMWPGEWSEPVAIPLPVAGSCPGIGRPWTGWIRTSLEGTPVGLMVDATGAHAWRSLPEPPAAAARGGMIIRAPGHLIAADSLLAWAVADARWVALPPLPDGPRTDVAAAWSHGRLHVWGGRSADGSLPATGWVFTPDPPEGTLWLPGGYPEGYPDCSGIGTNGAWRLVADPDDPMLVWFAQGSTRVRTIWPDGTVVRFADGTFSVIDADGDVIARAGQRYQDRLQPGDLEPCWMGSVASF